MSYRLTARDAYLDNEVTIYDGTDAYPADNIKLTTGNNDVGTLTFRIPSNHPNWSQLSILSGPQRSSKSKVVLTHYDDRVSVDKKPDSQLFVGEITGVDSENGFMTVTCRDYLGAFETFTFRLDDFGVTEGRKNIASLMPSVMRQYNSRISGSWLPTISGCTVVVGYQTRADAGRTYGRVDSGGTVTNPSNLFPTVYHVYELDKPRTMLDLLVSVAKSIGAVVTLEYDGSNWCEIVFHAATTDPNAHVYEYGKDIVRLRQYADWTEYRNALLVSGGTSKVLRNSYTTRDTYVRLMLAASASIGDGTIKLKTTSGSVTLPQGSLFYIEGNYYGFHEVSGEVTLTTSSTEVAVSPYIQANLTYSSSSPIYIRAWISSADDLISEIGPVAPNTPTQSDTYYKFGRLVYHRAETAKYGMRVAEFTDSNIINTTLLADRAAEEIDRRINSTFINMDVKILAVEVTHDYNSGDRSSHTMVGTIVHIKHPATIPMSGDIDVDMRVDGMTISVDDPTQNEYVFGTAKRTISKNVKDLDKSIDNRMYDKGLR